MWLLRMEHPLVRFESYTGSLARSSDSIMAVVVSSEVATMTVASLIHIKKDNNSNAQQTDESRVLANGRSQMPLVKPKTVSILAIGKCSLPLRICRNDYI